MRKKETDYRNINYRSAQTPGEKNPGVRGSKKKKHRKITISLRRKIAINMLMVFTILPQPLTILVVLSPTSSIT